MAQRQFQCRPAAATQNDVFEKFAGKANAKINVLVHCRLIAIGRKADWADLLDTQVLPENPRSPPPYTPWKPLGLKAEWDIFVKGKSALVRTKTMKVVNEFLPRLRER